MTFPTFTVQFPQDDNASMPYRTFLSPQDDNASMPYLNTDYSALVRYIRGRQERYNWRLDRVWVQHLDIVQGCSFFVQQRVITGPCELQLPFLCEMGEGRG